ncbi:MAG: 6-phosphofructo-2-kinase/fructose-2,6-bisphosphatase [Myxococcota bacterium]|nr:6-phosphofructo-2-kinase/fructose-2,6-bisphosphatase [Myxococcota bacterium]
MSRPRRGRKYLVAMVGLPARGKTFTARKIAGYMGWLGYPTRSFNVGEARREQLGPGQSHDFFDPSNRDAAEQRGALGQQVLDEAMAWLRGEGRIAIYDATNSTKARRDAIRARCAAEDREFLFVEISNDDPVAIEANVRETKLSSPDYSGFSTEEALQDFRARIAHYEAIYEPLGEEEGSWVRLRDRGRQVVIHEVFGWIPGRILSLLTNLQVSRRPVWITRHGQSQFNVEDRIGGDSGLSGAGAAYATNLARYVRENPPGEDLDVWTSTLQRTIQTAAPLEREFGDWRALDEIDAGICDGMTYGEVRERMPAEYEARRLDKFDYRYPRGESYRDVVQRLDRVIVELERYRTPVLVVAHRAVLRVLTAYFLQIPVEKSPWIDLPLHTIVKLTPTAYGCIEERTVLPPQVGEAETGQPS